MGTGHQNQLGVKFLGILQADGQTQSNLCKLTSKCILLKFEDTKNAKPITSQLLRCNLWLPTLEWFSYVLYLCGGNT